MPIYEYICGKCGKRFEKRQGFDEEPVALCPSCNGSSKRLIQCVPVIFRGSGFYVTDYKKDSPCPAGTEAKKDETAPAVSSEPKKETAAAAVSESKSPESKSTESRSKDSGKEAKSS